MCKLAILLSTSNLGLQPSSAAQAPEVQFCDMCTSGLFRTVENFSQKLVVANGPFSLQTCLIQESLRKSGFENEISRSKHSLAGVNARIDVGAVQ